MPKPDSRPGQLNVDINPKLLFLAKVAARYKDQSLSKFLENAVKAALTPATILNDEPNVTDPTGPKQDTPLFLEALWHDDELTRLYNVAVTDLRLLAPKQRELFVYISHELIKQDKKVTLQNFVGCFDTSKDGE